MRPFRSAAEEAGGLMVSAKEHWMPLTLKHIVTQSSLVRSLASFESSLNDKLSGGGHEIRSNSANQSIGKAARLRGG